MARQTIFLFVRAFIIGSLLHAGLNLVSETPPPQFEVLGSHQTQHHIIQPVSSINVQFLYSSNF